LQRAILATASSWSSTVPAGIKAGRYACRPILRLLKLPPYAPELNPVEHLWDDLREKSFHNRVFQTIGALEDHLCEALRQLELDHARVRSIVAWPWIINSLKK